MEELDIQPSPYDGLGHEVTKAVIVSTAASAATMLSVMVISATIAGVKAWKEARNAKKTAE